MKSFCLLESAFVARPLASVFGVVAVWLAGTLALLAAGPTITQQPQNLNVIAGDTATFQVTASGVAPLSYQWRHSNTNLPNQTNTTLSLANVQSSQAGAYRVVVSDSGGATTSVVAQLIVRPPGTSIYMSPSGGWTYLYDGNTMATPGTAALDGTWNHDNGSDAWAGDLRGLTNPPEGGLSVSNGILTMEDVLVSGAGIDNRRFYFTHPLAQDPLTNANTILSDGVTFTFRARLTPMSDPLIELTNAPNGFINANDGKGMVGLRQSGGSGMIISFSLNMASEESNTNATFLYGFPAAGLHMNNLNGNARHPNVDPGEGGTVNVFPIDPAQFHEFWVTVQDNGADPGTHRVTVYADGSTTPTVFNVTAGVGSDTPLTNYLAIGMPSTTQRGAFDLDWLGYKQGVHVPLPNDVPVQIVGQPASQTVNEGQTATFTVNVSGTPPISFQWFRNNVAISGATEASYTTALLLPADSGAAFHVECQNVGGVATSDPATLTVIADTNRPVLLSAASMSGQMIGVCFDERVTAASAQNIANYSVNNGQVSVTSATLRSNANGTTVLLQVTGLSTQANTLFTVRATNISDVSFAGNLGGGTVQGVVHGLTAADIGTANGTSFTCASNRFELAAAGSGMAGTADAFYFISMARTGDFDVRAKISQLTPSHAAAQAGLIARVDQTAGSRALNVFVTPPPGDNAYHATRRTTPGGATAVWPGGSDKAGVPLPNAWIRLMRAGDVFTAWHGTNGVDWQVYGQVTDALPATLFVGLGGAGLSDSVCEEFIFIPSPQIIAQPTNVVAIHGDLVTFSVQAVSQADISYQWRRNGVNVPDATNSTLSLPNVHPSVAGTYDVRVANGGGTVLSAAATLTVRVLDYGDASAAYPTLLANNGARHFLTPGFHLGTAADFELDGSPGVSANGDDVAGTDDEDGVEFISPLWVDQSAVIAVVASSNGVLNGWIDYGADGSWSQLEDHVFVDYALEPGTNLLSLNVPFDAKGTNTFARFRFSRVGGLLPHGPANDGEVEDYSVAVVPVADLSIAAVASPAPVAVGSNLTFQVAIDNVGPALATGVTVTNQFSHGVEFVSATSTRGSCVNNAGVINCAIGDLGLGNSATITVVVKPQQAGSLSTTFGIFANQPDPNTGNNLAVNATTVELPPVITVQPASLVVTQHNTAMFSVTASGTAPLGYQWFHNSSPLPNRTDSTLVIADALNANQGNYQVRVTNRVGGTLSQVVTLTVLDPPVISQQPQSRTNFAGSTASFNVVANGTAPLSYQWFLNATNSVLTATNPSLALSNVQVSQSGAYSVRVSNSAGVTNSTNAVLTVVEMDFGDAPAPFPTLFADNGARHLIVPGFFLGTTVDFEPDGQTSDGADEDGVSFHSALLLGQSARIDVTASSNGVLNAWVDWNGNGNWSDAGERIFSDRALTAGMNVLNATVPAGAQLGARAARFRFSSAAGTSFTGAALDGEVEDYVVNLQPAVDLAISAVANPADVRVGSNVVYNIVVTNRGPSTASGLVLTSTLPATMSVGTLPAGCTNQGGVITCNLSNLNSGSFRSLQITAAPNQTGMITNQLSVAAVEQDFALSNNVTEVVVAALEFPAITGQPQSLTVTNGDLASFEVTATGSALSYQWTFNGGDISGATSSVLIIDLARPANEGVYRVRIANALGSVISGPAQLTVLVPPLIVTQPASVTVIAGSTANFTVSASGTAPLTYQWTFGGTDLPNETNTSLSIPSAGAANEGVYRVRVANAAGEALSDPANLVVLVPATITQQPQSKTVFAGGNATLQVVASGSQPISYQWFINGTNRLTFGTNATLMLSNIQVAQTGPYHVVVSNSVATAVSAAAQLTVREADFGDVDGPSYATLLVFNAAYHFLTPGVRLGAAIDFEPDGQPTLNANGDDASSLDDEDGVAFVAPLLVGQVARVNVTASTNGFLDAWIDFNGNGDWTDPGEQIFISRSLVAGTNALQFNIPAGALAHGAMSRFRFSTAGGLFFGGGAADGEVEDYVAQIVPAVELSVTLVDTPDPVLVESNLHLFVTISNAGPSTATGVVLREQLPISASFLSAMITQGSCANQGGVLVCELGEVMAGNSVTVDINLTPRGIGIAAHRADLFALEHDLNPTNNVAVQLTTVVTAAGPYSNPEYIALNDFGPAAIYPSTITVSGVTGTVHQVVVTLHNLSHVFPDDLDLLLVGPQGQKVIIMSDAGGQFDPAFTTFFIDDTSDLILPDDDLIIDEPYRPANYEGTNDTFAAPAPGGPYANRLAAFKGTDANGVWSLYIVDDFAQDSGELAGGWSLQFYVLDPIADASVGISASPSPVAVGQNVTYTVMVTNGGPSAVMQMLVTNALPANAILQSYAASQGACTNAAGEITCDLGVMEAGGVASLTAVVTPQQIGVLSNYARVTPSQVDLNQANNFVSLLTPVRYLADVSIATRESRDPAPFGQPFTYTLTVSNRGPQLAASLVVTDQLPAGFQLANVTPSQGSCSNESGIITCQLGDLASGNQATIQIIGQATYLGRFTNSASVQGSIIDTDLSNNQTMEETVVVYAAPPVMNTTGISIPVPYPSTILVSGLTGALYKVSVIVSNLNHSTPESLRLLLVGPAGQNVLLMNSAGGNTAVANATLRFDDQAAAAVPDGSPLVSGEYRPASYTVPASLPAPAPAAPYGGALSVFQGTDANGTWALFARDTGSIGAWGLEISTLEPIADVSVNVASIPAAVSVTSNLTYMITVSNRGPAVATGILFTNVSPTSLGLTSSVGCSNICNLGSLNAGSRIEIVLNGTALAEGFATNIASAFAAQRDLNPSNNVAAAVTLMKTPPVISGQPQSVTVTNGDTATFAVTVTGTGPFTYQWLRNGAAVNGATNETLVINGAQQVHAGDYAVRVSDGVGSPLSATARLTVLNRPTISDVADITLAEDTTSPELPVIIGDFETAVLALEALSSNPALTPTILLGGTGSNRTVRIFPATNQSGTATITLTVRDTDGITASDTFHVTVTAENDLPVLGPVANQNLAEDTPRSLLLEAADVEDASAQLVLAAVSSDSNLFTVGIADRTLTITPRPDQFGGGRVTVTLTDTGGGVVSNFFDVVVHAVNDPPTLNVIPTSNIEEESGQVIVPLSGISSGAANEPDTTLTVRASLSDSNLLAGLMVSYAGGASGSLSFSTVSNLTGAASITVTVDDGGTSNNIIVRTFLVLVGDVNDPPFISPIADQLIAEDASLQVPFTVTDEETPAHALVLAGTSSNTNLVRDSSITFLGTNNARTLVLVPEPNQSGSAIITVSVTDGLATTVTEIFQLQVAPVNDPPLLNVVSVVNVTENSGAQTITLNNIGPGAPDEEHNLLVIATSSNPTLIPDPIVHYSNPNTGGSLSFTPQPDRIGSAVITIVVNDRGTSNNITVRTVTVNVTEENNAPTVSQIFNQITPEDTDIDIPFTVFDGDSPVNTLTFFAVSSNPALISNSALTISGTGTNRFLRAGPTPNLSGSSSITITATDTNGASSSVTFLLTVAPINDAPVIGIIVNQQVAEDGVMGPVFFYVNDLETAAGALSLSAVASNPALVPQTRIGFGGVGTNRWIRIIPSANRSGSTLITVTARDADGRGTTASFTLTVQGANDPPAISAIADQTTSASVAITVPFTISDLETAPEALLLSVTSSNPALLSTNNVVFGGAENYRSVTLTPVPNATGTSIVAIIVSDGFGGSASETFAFRVASGSGPPLITIPPQSQTVTNGGTATFTVGASGAPTLRYRWRLNGTNLAATNHTMVLTNVRAADAGEYSVSVNNSIGSVTSTVAILTVFVPPSARTPTIANIVDQTVAEDGSLVLNVSLQDADTAPHFLSLSASSTNTTLVPANNYFFEGATLVRTLTIVPGLHQVGTNLITVTVSDGTFSSSDDFVLRISAANDAPTLDRLSNVSALAGTTVSMPLTGIGPGAPNETLPISITAAHNNPNVLTNLTITYTPNQTTGMVSVLVLSNATGSATITVTAADGGPSTLRTFQIVVRPPTNSNPIIAGITNLVINEDTSMGPIPFTVDDPNGSPSQVTLIPVSGNTALLPASGIVFGGTGSNRTMTITPLPNQFGSTVIMLTAADSQSGLFTTNFTVTVNSVNDLPFLPFIANQSLAEDTLSAPITIRIRDTENPPSALQLSGTSANQTLIPNANLLFGGSGSNRVLVIKPAEARSGSTTITITLTDLDGGSVSSNIIVGVGGVNDPPRISSIDDLSIPPNTSTGPLGFTISDEETLAGSLNVTASASDTNLVPAVAGSITLGGTGTNRTVAVQPAAGRTGAATITVTVSDGNVATSESFVLHVTQTNTPPTLDPLPDVVMDEDSSLPTTVNLTGISPGVNEPGQIVAISASSSNPDVVPDPGVTYTSPGSTGGVTFTPVPGTNGTAEITMIVHDGQAVLLRTFNVTVRARPLLSFIADFSVNEDALSAPISFLASDVETPASNLVFEVASSNPAIVSPADVVVSAGNTNRTLTVRGAPDQFGHSFITLTVIDGHGLTRSNTFVVFVNAVNDPPTLDPISPVTLSEDQASHTVNLAGIGAGPANESQPLMVAVTSSNPGIVPPPAISYTSPNATGSLSLTPVPTASGSATITVTVNDGQSTNQFVQRTFDVTVTAIDDPPTLNAIADLILEQDAGPQTVVLTGITPGEPNEGQTASVQASGSSPPVIANLSVSYSFPSTVGTLTFTPIAGSSGTNTVTVTVRDGPNSFSQTFMVVMRPPPTRMTITSLGDQTIAEDSVAGPLSFTVATDSGATDVQLSAVSSDPALVPVERITFGGSGTNRTVSVAPATNAYGSAIITVRANDGGNMVSASFQLTVTPVDDFPYFSQPVLDTVMDEDGTLTIFFYIDDAETDPGGLVIGRNTRNPELIPDDRIEMGWTPTNERYLVLRPLPNRFGTALIEVRVRDSAVQRATNNFILTVRPVEDPPVLSGLSDQVTMEDELVEIGFLVDDIETPPGDLVVTATSSNTNLVADSGLQLVNNGMMRLLRIQPAADQSGSNIITVTVRDGGGMVVTGFVNVRVVAANDPPVISSLPAASTSVNQPTPQLPVTVDDVETAAPQLTLSGRSSNTNLVPVSNIEFFGGDSNRTVRVTPANGQSGLALITVEVSDPHGGKAETTFELLVNPTNGVPVIVVNPQGQRVNLGQTVTLRVAAIGPGPLGYQWQRNGTTLPGQTAVTLSFPSIQASDSGIYRAVVSNSEGSTTSAEANLEVYAAARIISITHSGASAELVFESALGQRYTVESRPSLGAGTWTPLQTLDGTGSPITFTDTGAAPGTRFYRLRIER